ARVVLPWPVPAGQPEGRDPPELRPRGGLLAGGHRPDRPGHRSLICPNGARQRAGSDGSARGSSPAVLIALAIDAQHTDCGRRPPAPRAKLAAMAEETGTDVRAKAINLVADVVRWIGLIAAVILVVHVVLVAGEANPANWITKFVRSLADVLSLGFKDLF